MDPETGRECRLVTIDVRERLKEYAEGKRPVRIKALQPEFFDPRTSEPIVWYVVEHGGTIEIFDLMGYHPETSQELLPVTPEIVNHWKAQQAQIGRKPPAQVDPDSHPWFDVKTGRPNIWHSPGENGALDFFNGPGFHPKTGKALTEITQDFAEKLRREKQRQADDLEREKQKRADDLEREKRDREAQQFAASCDQLAGNPNDQRRRSDGVSYDQLRTQVPEAIRLCELAVQQFPKDLTLQYQLARAVELVDPTRGQAMQDRLVKFGYPAAFDNAGSLLLNEKGCRQHCINEAVKLFRKGAALEDPDAMMSLADQIGQNHATGDRISLYQRAAKLGHPRAKMALEALAQERTPPRPIFRFPF
jgi:hypothetical protein